MTGSQYKNVAQWTLANTTTDGTASDTAAAKAVFDNCGVAFPSGDSEEVLMTLMTDEYMGWENCTYAQAQEAANNGIATVGVDADHVVVILPDDTVSASETIAETESSVARTVSEISTTERSTMQFFAYTATTTTTQLWKQKAELLISTAESKLGCGRNDFTGFSSAWCVDFVCWCAAQNGLRKDSIMKQTSSSSDLRNWFKNNQPSRLHTGTTGLQRGDIVFFKYDTDTDIHHTAIALSGVKADGKVDTINGNWGGAVKKQAMPYTDQGKTDSIYQYAHPNYLA